MSAEGRYRLAAAFWARWFRQSDFTDDDEDLDDEDKAEMRDRAARNRGDLDSNQYRHLPFLLEYEIVFWMDMGKVQLVSVLSLHWSSHCISDDILSVVEEEAAHNTISRRYNNYIDNYIIDRFPSNQNQKSRGEFTSVKVPGLATTLFSTASSLLEALNEATT